VKVVVNRRLLTVSSAGIPVAYTAVIVVGAGTLLVTPPKVYVPPAVTSSEVAAAAVVDVGRMIGVFGLQVAASPGALSMKTSGVGTRTGRLAGGESCTTVSNVS
jgi:hypothetical protein